MDGYGDSGFADLMNLIIVDGRAQAYMEFAHQILQDSMFPVHLEEGGIMVILHALYLPTLMARKTLPSHKVAAREPPIQSISDLGVKKLLNLFIKYGEVNFQLISSFTINITIVKDWVLPGGTLTTSL